MNLIRINKFMFTFRNNWPLIIVSLIWYSVIVYLAGYLNLWEDEVYSLNTTSGTLAYAFRQSVNFELQPPVYFLSLTVWRTFSDTVIWARLFSVLLIFASQLIFYNFAKKITDRQKATFFTILFILNPLTVYAALEIRTFPMVLFLSILILRNFYEVYYRNDLTPAKRIIFILVSIFGLFTQYYIGFMLFANAVALLLKKNWRSLRFYILDMIIPLCLILLYIPIVQSNLDVKFISTPEYTRTLSGFLTEMKELVSQMTFGYFLPFDFVGSRFWHRLLKVIVLVSFLLSLNYPHIKRKLHDASPFMIIAFIIMLFFIAVLFLFNPYAVESKYTLIIFIPLLVSLMLLSGVLKAGTINLWILFFAVIYLTANFSKYRDLYKVKDFRSICNYLQENEKSGEPIFVYRNISAENMSFYYNGKNEINPLPDKFDYSKSFGPVQWEIDKDDLKRLNEKFIKYDYFYVVIDNSPLRGVNEANTELLSFLEQNYNLLEEKSFKGRLDMYKFYNSNVSENTEFRF